MLGKRPLGPWLLAGIVLVGGLACWLGISHHPGRDLSYQGKPLRYWFNQLPMTRTERIRGSEQIVQSSRKQARHLQSGALQSYGSWQEEPATSMKAIHSIGTNGLTLYLSKLKRQEYSTEKRIQKAAFRLGLRRFLFEDTDAEREQAVTALILLKPLPEKTVQELATLSTNANPGIAGAARCVLATQPGKLLLMHPPLNVDDLLLSPFEVKGRWQ